MKKDKLRESFIEGKDYFQKVCYTFDLKCIKKLDECANSLNKSKSSIIRDSLDLYFKLVDDGIIKRDE